jgi:hypothetical protein
MQKLGRAETLYIYIYNKKAALAAHMPTIPDTACLTCIVNNLSCLPILLLWFLGHGSDLHQLHKTRLILCWLCRIVNCIILRARDPALGCTAIWSFRSRMNAGRELTVSWSVSTVQAREYADKDNTETRHTGADDTNVQFDCWPDASFQKVPLQGG